MPSTVHVSFGWFIGAAVAAVFVIVYPLVLAIIARKRLGVGWRYFGYGVLVFLVFQIATRVPAVLVLQNVFAAQLQHSLAFLWAWLVILAVTALAFLWAWLVILAVTAGLFEEVGRYVGYRLFMRREEKTWSKAVMYGIGHGGLESMLLVGGALILTIINATVYSSINLNTLPQAQHALVVQQVAAINSQPAWTTLLSAWERLWTLPIQIALSVLVLQVFQRHSLNWLWLAILAHAIVDFTAVAVIQIWGKSLPTTLIVEGIVALFGLIAIWIIWRLRDRPGTAAVPSVVPDTPIA